MKNSHLELRIPGYIKYFIVLASLMLTGYAILIAKPIFNPLLAAFIIGLLLKPLSTSMERIKIPRIISTLLSLLLILMVITGLSMFFSAQISAITTDMDSLINSFNSLFDKLQQWTATQFGIAPQEQIVYLKSSLSTLLKNSSSFFRSTLSATAGFFSTFLLFIMALFFFLYYRTFLVSFLYYSIDKGDHRRLNVILRKIESVVRRYILGLFLVILIMATLNIVGLLAMGIQHAVFFGALAALLTIIPYVGIIIGSLLPIMFTLATMDSLWYPFGVLLLFAGVQFLEGNFITPNIIGNQVSINPFAALLGLFIGGIMLGIIGVIFAIPILAIIKVICDEVESLKPVGYLIGNPPKRSLPLKKGG